MELTTAAPHCRASPPPPCSSFTSFSLAPCLPWSPEPSHHASWRTELTLNCVFKLCWIWHAGEELGDKDHGQKSLALQPFLLISPTGDSHESKNVYITVSSQICYPLRLLPMRGEVTTVWMLREQHKPFTEQLSSQVCSSPGVSRDRVVPQFTVVRVLNLPFPVPWFSSLTISTSYILSLIYTILILT